jgi:quercetin dioxygenase-like cupin family protein
MALIQLAPGEQFSHSHSGDSVTVLLRGQVDLRVGSKTHHLVKDVSFTVPGGEPHEIINVGPDGCEVQCEKHIVRDPPPPPPPPG